MIKADRRAAVQVETGNPYMLYKDNCNRKSNQQNLVRHARVCDACCAIGRVQQWRAFKYSPFRLKEDMYYAADISEAGVRSACPALRYLCPFQTTKLAELWRMRQFLQFKPSMHAIASV